MTWVALGIILLTHGYVLKIITFTIAGTVDYFESIGFPAIVIYLVIAGEIFDGLALLIGAFKRLVARLSIPILLGATWIHLVNNSRYFQQRAVDRNSYSSRNSRGQHQSKGRRQVRSR